MYLIRDFFVHLLPEEKYNMAGIHHFAVNTPMVNDVEIFFDFESSVKSGVLALSYAADKKVGYASVLNKVFYTNALEIEEAKRNANTHLQLLEMFMEEEVPRAPIIFEKPEDFVISTEDLFKSPEPRPFIFCHFGNQISEIEDPLFDVLDGFDEQLFVHWLPDENYGKDLFKDFSPGNKHLLHADSSPEKIRRLIYLSLGVITTNPVTALLGSALGKKVFLFNSRAVNMNFSYYSTQPTQVGFNEAGLTNMHPPDGASCSVSSTRSIVDEIHKAFFLLMKSLMDYSINKRCI